MAKSGTLAKIADLQYSVEVAVGPITVGIDLGDRFSHCCLLGCDGEVLTEGRVRTTPEGMSQHFKGLPPIRIALEVGTHSRWVSKLLEDWGHEVIVANTRIVQLIAANNRKSDQVDAQMLARLARADPKLLHPITHLGEETYPDVVQIRARHLLVRARTRLINAVRGMVKTVGVRLPACSADIFDKRIETLLPPLLQGSLSPLIVTITHLTKQIREYDRAIEHTARYRYPHTARLRQISGVGPITALHYVLTIGDPHRFDKSRDVAAYLGLVPKRRQSGNMDQQLRISKTGNRDLRTLLVQCAQYLLGRYGPDSDLKRWGTAMAARGGKNAKRRAIIAVARKLSVLLHKLWVSGVTYHPLFNTAAARAAG